ncbi:pheromone A receptor-domain-containing protein [Daldinia vernicosa]|uniref:pheromone A receptor-domain-containing protein n=1 Tax=Daldinia vernicosa TaxID=114800 RepID=UPI0020082CA6|nr:pheromone A receptor-domain-containing protein [Daldinia vernicosa]KAI0847929.1 pheromone A receptor-domain-containing protein [Daldinia vernicosa]
MSIMVKVVVAIAFMAFATAAASDQDGSADVDWKHTPNIGIQINLVLRVVFAIIGTGLCWPPLRTLWRYNDLPGVSLIIVVAIMNFFAVLNAMIWSQDNWDDWYDGQGLCDVQAYLSTPMKTIYAATIFVTVYELAQKFDVRRAILLNSREDKFRELKQALIIFLVPFIQLVMTYFTISQRYKIGTLIGCIAEYDNNWLKIIVFDVPIPIFVVLSVPFTFCAYLRYRRYSRESQLAIESSNQGVARHIRLRIRLYHVTASIMLVYAPVSFILLSKNIQMAVQEPPSAYDFHRIHDDADPYPWDSVTFVPSWNMEWLEMNQPWFAIMTTVTIIGFFGTSEDCSPVYRGYMEWLGLGRCLPRPKPQEAPPSQPHFLDDPDELLRNGIELVEMGGGNREVAERRMPTDPPQVSSSSSDINEILSPRRPVTPQQPLPPPSVAASSPPPSPSQFPMPPLQRRLPMPMDRLDSIRRHINMPGSPLERVIIQSFIPERRSSLQGQQLPSLFRAPVSRHPRVPHSYLTSFHRDDSSVAGPSRSHARTHSERSDSQPILAATAEHVTESPRTATPARRQVPQEAVQPRELLDDQSSWSGTRRLTADNVVWPLFSRTASTSSLARPRETANAIAAANESPVRSTDSDFVRVRITGTFSPSLPSPPPPAEQRGRGRRIPRELLNRVGRNIPRNGNGN